MKRIAFFQDNLDVGGIQKSLVNLLRNFDYDNYQVDLYLSDKKSFWNVDFPEQLNIKYLKHIPRIYTFIPFDVARSMVSLDFGDCEEYDLAIDFNSYQFSCALGALTVPAKRRVMWIHNNVSVKLENEWKYRVLWENFKDKFKYYDKFVGVSKGVIEPFMASSGIYDSSKFTVIQNTIDTDEIFTKSKAETDFTVDPDKTNFVAIGRLCHQKAYDIMLDVFAKACQQRDDLHLYIIGDGDKRFFLEYQRDSLGLTDKVTFLGQQTNPFKYMDKMDAFISTSRYEGQGMNIMEARALGLPIYCTKNLELYNEGLAGYEDIVSAIVSAHRVPKAYDDLHEYNSEIIRRIKQLAEPEEQLEKKKTVNIIALHLGMGGVEKAIISMANLFAERYDVTLFSIYKMPGSPAFSVDSRVKVLYMLRDTPNREEWREALKNIQPIKFFKESLRSIRIILGKKHAVKKIIKSIDSGVIITTRHEDNVPLSKYGSKNVLKIAQLHHDHGFIKKYVRGFKYQYGGIDVLAMLTPQLVEEVQQLMLGHNSHTQVIYMPNFLEHYPEQPQKSEREKIVLAAGRLTAVKRFDLLIREFANIHSCAPDWTLRILGDGEDGQKLQQQIHELGAEDYIILAGRKNGSEVEQEMCRASFFAMSSSSEGFPFVLLEAQSCAMPILAYDVRVGPGFIVHQGEDGYLVPEGDEAVYEQRMLEMMAEPEMLRRMGDKAVEEAKEFSRENVANKWYSVIEK
jgi:N-acetylglucosaminyldiphosphoundecaprenol N-acetyl-beta-D-mannosaminyltransferase